ncbi:MAG: DUF1439 domain-containing protein [Glaciimonas sp.]|nr:DUF1439 domain-containing protein [Glaciimonas sp.]
MQVVAQLIVAITLFGSAILPASAGYNVWTSEYTFSLPELQTAIAKKFPVQLRYAEVFDVQVSHPRMTLDSAQNRVITTVDVKVSSALLLPTPLNGKVALSSRLKYDPASRAIQLDAPNVDHVDVNGLPAQYIQQLNAIGAVVAQQVLQGYPIHTFAAEDLRIANKAFEPGAITVQSDGIAVQIN